MRGLLERIGPEAPLTGRVSEDKKKDVQGEAIEQHLAALLNCTQGDSLSAPRYGIVDLTDLLTQLPDSMGKVQEAMRSAIAQHETRLTDVEVRVLPPAPENGRAILRFEVVARRRGTRSPVFRWTTRLEAGTRFRSDR